MNEKLLETVSTSEDKRANPILDQATKSALVAKAVLMLTLLVAVGGWLWLLGKGAVAIARLL